MFSRFTGLATLAFVVVATASPLAGVQKYTCGSGSKLQCCNNKNDGGKPVANGAAGLLALVGQIQVPIAVSCTNVNVIGFLADSSKCQQTVACCKDNNQNGVVNLQCIPAGVQV
ncbi:fungal hydrophobin-domain-containing protein [Flagelloscypha sp. PMI_526]|nr:fungal hydrophobin-domain-containing protein [Flagelloscypha sp. PMI_526]